MMADFNAGVSFVVMCCASCAYFMVLVCGAGGVMHSSRMLQTRQFDICYMVYVSCGNNLCTFP
jgi:hypothetical protein